MGNGLGAGVRSRGFDRGLSLRLPLHRGGARSGCTFGDDAARLADFGQREVEGGPPERIGVGEEFHALWLTRGDELIIVEATAFRPGVRLRRAAEALIAAQ